MSAPAAIYTRLMPRISEATIAATDVAVLEAI
jgi:hypothetical protein